MTKRKLTQWVLLCALVFSVVGMHHVAAAETPHAAHTMSHHEEQPHEHDLTHLCLAVLVAAAVVLLGWFLVRTALPRLAEPADETPPSTPQRPPPGGRQLLTTLCVLRI
ncbi:hypothetical protein GCM10011609_04720 [Lentzea pudingi]|uniref:Secreted protein n=1 Tax=Lentzea pudingi TaxID=1789439 RepID=A0ABQ2HB98_9PSEU|nr:hypothetical protein [Lentzea pudingi]GGM72006.1 hypothetical protein GCM10011609_04720 [Lentzea pudingi]